MSNEESADRWHPPKKDPRSEWRLATGQDVDRALTSAERMLRSAEELLRHQQNVRLALYSFIILGLVSIAALLVSVIDSRTLPFAYTLPLAAIGALIATAASMRLLVFIKSIRSLVDYRLQSELANEIAGQVESVYLEVAYREKWSNLQLTTTKARLAAFELNQRGWPSRRTLSRDDESRRRER